VSGRWEGGGGESGWLTTKRDETTKSKKKCNRYIDRLFRKTVIDLSRLVSSRLFLFYSPLVSSDTSPLVSYRRSPLLSSLFIYFLLFYYRLVSSLAACHFCLFYILPRPRPRPRPRTRVTVCVRIRIMMVLDILYSSTFLYVIYSFSVCAEQHETDGGVRRN
jgi:hypothetical protein